ncbi:calcium-binding protein [Tabrizicola thermarum]|uniref:calcium-binding protein n=1 Tax=Tabrizicola thermarum TaxID=2670345 RepID=UPI000FFCBF96|nr:calcium-binding protein [Tabrizicola thermarum]
MLELLAPIFLGLTALVVFDSLSRPDDPSEDSSDGEDTQPESDPPQTISLNELGSFCGGDEDDDILVRTKTGTSTFYDWDVYASIPDDPVMEVRGGLGDDTLRLSGGGYRVFGDEGSDVIYAQDASDIAIYGGSGDTVFGGTGDHVYTRLSDDAIFIGGDGNDFVISSSTASTNLGCGDDVFLGLKEGWNSGETATADLVYGGQGNDLIFGTARESYLWSTHANDQDLVSLDADTLYGGYGDDTLIGSHGDLLFGGEGMDNFQVVLNLGGSLPTASVEDFDPHKEHIEVRVGAGDGDELFPEYYRSLKFSDFSQHVNEAGDSVLRDKFGSDLLRVSGTGELKIGLEGWDSDRACKCFLDLNGNEIAQADCHILIRGQVDAYL